MSVKAPPVFKVNFYCVRLQRAAILFLEQRRVTMVTQYLRLRYKFRPLKKNKDGLIFSIKCRFVLPLRVLLSSLTIP